MSDHLPECGYSPGQPGFGGINSGIPSTQPYLAPSPCICDELRACEQRVLDAAREAVEAELGWEEPDPSDDFKPHTAIWKFRALAAIDALRQKP